MRIFERFRMDQGGATAMLFGLSLVPLMGAFGAAVDYGRAANEQTKLQTAVDAAVLALVKEPKTASPTDLRIKAKAVLGALYQPLPGTVMTDPAVNRQGNTITLSASGVMQNAFMQVLGLRDVALATEARAAWGTERIELALVLDNTGSMGDLIEGQRKIDVLIDATKTLLQDFKGMADRPDAIKVSVVPFDTEVRLDADANRYKDWYRPVGRTFKPSDWTGYVIDRFGDFATSDTSIGHDKNSRYPALRESGHQTDSRLRKLSSIDLPTVKPLTSLYRAEDYRDTERLIERMRPRGYTNIALGVTWGMATLSKSEPFTEGSDASDGAVKRYMIVLTDGKNTAYHKDGVLKNAEWEKEDKNWRAAERIEDEMNAATAAACTAAKSNVEVFTVRLLEGDQKLLRSCASPPNRKIGTHYFDVQSPPQLSAAFREILDAISGTRLTH